MANMMGTGRSRTQRHSASAYTLPRTMGAKWDPKIKKSADNEVQKLLHKEKIRRRGTISEATAESVNGIDASCWDVVPMEWCIVAW